MLDIHQIPCLSDNYGYLIEDKASGKVASIDTPDADAIIAAAKARDLRIDQIWNTHWHPDHAGGNAKIKAEFGSVIYAPKEVSGHGFACDEIIFPDSEISLGESHAKIIDVSGHTLGHIAFVFAQEKCAFVGDALFVLGCGRLFEGDGNMAWAGLSRLMVFDDDMEIYCAHEYSAANARFCQSLNLSNQALAARVQEIFDLTAKSIPTVPTKLGKEKLTNPFLLADKVNLLSELELIGASDAAAFSKIRKMKDEFRG
ncbi:MAG: hydroxyacylglutathione hydrolase [Pseudomonadota bacterium]